MPPREGVYGLLAEFNTPSELVHATEMAHRAGYRRMECYTPYPVEEAAEALRFHKTGVPLMCLVGGVMGLITGYGMEVWVNVWGYPLNIAGRPLFNAPNFRDGATTDKFFLCLEAHDPKFSPVDTREFLETFSPISVVEVDH